MEPWQLADEFYDALMQNGYRPMLSLHPEAKIACLRKGSAVIGISTRDDVKIRVMLPYNEGIQVSGFDPAGNGYIGSHELSLTEKNFDRTINRAAKLIEYGQSVISEARLGEYIQQELGLSTPPKK